jgi:hypothetical protein
MKCQQAKPSAAGDIFWGEIAPCDHAVQIYADDGSFVQCLTDFVAAGLRNGEGVIVIATPAHLFALEDRLDALKLDLDTARYRDQYITLDAEATLARFMENGWPNAERFRAMVHELLGRGRGGGRRVRAFGEMVAILWSRGYPGATIQLEHLWQNLCRAEGLALFCAYPKAGFTRDAAESLREICAMHSRVVPVAGG